LEPTGQQKYDHHLAKWNQWFTCAVPGCGVERICPRECWKEIAKECILDSGEGKECYGLCDIWISSGE
jgi:hypothetical protein